MPLPHVKRQAAAAAAAKNKAASQPESEAKGVKSPQQLSPSTTKSATRDAETSTAPQPNASSKASVAVANGQRPLAGGEFRRRRRVDQYADLNLPGAKLSPLPHEKEMPTVSPKPTNAAPNLDNDTQSGADRTPKPSQPAAPIQAQSRQETPKEHAAIPSVSIPASQSMRQMPPAFQPAANRPDAVTGNISQGPPPPVINGHPHMHKPHPSNGSVHFGAFHDSAGSSPAPPHSGGVAPPPGMPPHDARQSWMPPAAHGYHPNLPPALDMAVGSNFDVYAHGRPDLAYSHLDPYGHYGNTLPPSTPQSFHESSGSVHHEDARPYNPLPPSTPSYPPPGFAESRQHSQPRINGNEGYPDSARPFRSAMMNGAQRPPSFEEHFRRFFASAEFSDCTLEVRNRDFVILGGFPGHRMVLSRSPVLHDLIRQHLLHGGDDRPHLLLRVEDDWIDPSSFYEALQNLYGFPLFQSEHPNSAAHEYMSAGTRIEKLRYALSYAAAGRLIGSDPVTQRGCEIASQLLAPETVETAFEFAVDLHEDKGTHDSFKWGDGSLVLLDAVLSFILNALPADFEFEPSALGSPYTRLPFDVPSPAKAVREAAPPVIVRGNGHNRGLSSQNANIQFGDLSINKGDERGSKQVDDALRSTLSRIIVNLPFGYLKGLLEAPFPPARLQITDAKRYQIVSDAVNEREKRRERAIEALRKGRVPDAAPIVAKLCSVEPTFVGQWSAVGWKEEIEYSTGGGAVLRRQWTPLREENRAPAPEYP